MRILLCLASVAVLCGPVMAAPCFEEGERAQMLTLDVKTFDQTKDQGWRLVAERECYVEAAALIAEYRQASGTERVKKDLRHHQMQMHAAAEERAKAIVLLDEMMPDLEAEKNYSGLAYRQATRAFLAGDRAALQQARADLLKVPEPEGFAEAIANYDKKYPGFEPPTWPINLDVIDGFLNCFNETYSVAYSTDCRVRDTPESQTE